MTPTREVVRNFMGAPGGPAQMPRTASVLVRPDTSDTAGEMTEMADAIAERPIVRRRRRRSPAEMAAARAAMATASSPSNGGRHQSGSEMQRYRIEVELV